MDAWEWPSAREVIVVSTMSTEVQTMTATVSIPTILRSFTANARSVTAEGATLAQVFADLDRQFTGIGERLIEGGKLRRFVNVYINDEDVRFLGGLEAPIADGDAVTVLPATDAPPQP